MATVHFIQQGKGGVGKSVIASFLYQVLRHHAKDVVAYDTERWSPLFGQEIAIS